MRYIYELPTLQWGNSLWVAHIVGLHDFFADDAFLRKTGTVA
jgi:hypothetical protein